MSAPVFGWCIGQQLDMPLTRDGCCAACNLPAIPPSWGRRTWTWGDGTWVPYLPKPDGWSWTMPTDDTPVGRTRRVAAPKPTPAPEPVMGVCAPCGKTYELARQGGSPQAYCSSICRARAASMKRAARRPALDPLPEAACRGCGRVFRPKRSRHGGVPASYCSDPCRSRAWDRQRREGAERANERKRTGVTG